MSYLSEAFFQMEDPYDVPMSTDGCKRDTDTQWHNVYVCLPASSLRGVTSANQEGGGGGTGTRRTRRVGMRLSTWTPRLSVDLLPSFTSTSRSEYRGGGVVPRLEWFPLAPVALHFLCVGPVYTTSYWI